MTRAADIDTVRIAVQEGLAVTTADDGRGGPRKGDLAGPPKPADPDIRGHGEARLDEALKETFPASDPIEMGEIEGFDAEEPSTPARRGDQRKE